MPKNMTCPQCGALYQNTPAMQHWLEHDGEVVGVDAILFRCPNGHSAKASASKRVPMSRKDFDAGKAACGNCGLPLTPQSFEVLKSPALSEMANKGGLIGRCRNCQNFVTVELRQGHN